MSAWAFAAAVCALLAPAGAARAATSAAVTLNFTGDYIGSTCKVIGASDMTVTLPTLSAQSLARAGQTAGETVFTIPIECDSETTGVRAYFESPLTDATTGNLNPQDAAAPGTAQNAQVRLSNPDGSPIRIGDRGTVAVVPITSTAPTTISFVASYYATGMASAGGLRTFVTYVLEQP